MRKALIVLFGCLIVSFSHAQEEVEGLKLSTFKNNVKLNPLKALGFFNPAIELSYERRLNNNYSLQYSAAFLFDGIFHLIDLRDKRGSRHSLELKRFFDRSSMFGNYLGFQTSFLETSYEQYCKFRDTHDPGFPTFGSDYSQDVFVFKNTGDFSVKMGYQKMWPSGFVVDAFLGVGIRYVNCRHIGRDDVLDKQQNDGTFDLQYEYSRAGKFFETIFPLGLRIGMAI